MRSLACAAAALALCAAPACAPDPAPAPPIAPAPARPPAPKGAPNILLITVDDMNWDSIGVYGAALPGLTPNIDRLARQGVRFETAFVTSPICQPSRSVWMTGRYPPSNGAIGFLPIREGTPTLADTLRDAGWRTGVFAKNSHTPPQDPARWDVSRPPRAFLAGRDPEAFARETRLFVRDSLAAGRPFFLNVNIQDPHRPFPGGSRPLWSKLLNLLANENGTFPTPPPPVVDVAHTPVPAALPDLPEVRRELAQYFTAVRRADVSVGRVLAVLEELDVADETLVIFTSDNGQPFPFAKQNAYLAGVRAPLIVRWPGRTPSGAVVRDLRPSGVDLMPTLLHAAGLPMTEGLDGRSFLPRLTGEAQDGADFEPVFTYVDRVDIQVPGLPRKPLGFRTRSVVTRQHLYIWNAWSDRKQRFITEAAGESLAGMKRAARTDPELDRRLRFFTYRTPEELYDLRADPDQLRNIAGDPAQARNLAASRKQLLDHLTTEGDPAAEAYRAFLARR